MKEEQVIAVLEASPLRRWVGLGTLVTTSLLVVWMALSADTGPALQAGALVLGAVLLWVADRFRQATALRIELTDGGLFESDGTCIARLQDIVSVERGALAFKPSNGFLIRTLSVGDRVWRPGMWWRIGSKIGVGGVTPVSQARFMADKLSELATHQDQVSAPSHLS